MKNSDAKFILKEIDGRIEKRKRPLPFVIDRWLGIIRRKVIMGTDLEKNDSKFLMDQYQRMTELTPLKWGHTVTLR